MVLRSLVFGMLIGAAGGCGSSSPGARLPVDSPLVPFQAPAADAPDAGDALDAERRHEADGFERAGRGDARESGGGGFEADHAARVAE